jgi:hypothetical protein
MDAALVNTHRNSVWAELGVFQGATFKTIYEHATTYGRRVIAVDSFIGMPPPVLAGEEKFAEGVFSTKGSAKFRKEFPMAEVYEGFIPSILEKIKIDNFGFVHLDIDHQKTTYEALEWLWSRIVHEGILVCHDFYKNTEICAPKAIKDWMKNNSIHHIGDCDHSIWFKKGVS